MAVGRWESGTGIPGAVVVQRLAGFGGAEDVSNSLHTGWWKRRVTFESLSYLKLDGNDGATQHLVVGACGKLLSTAAARSRIR
jgi:hypothetical protein